MISRAEKEDILLVDDKPENLKILAHILKSKGYVIRLAKNGAEAIESVESKPPKLILLDVQMPVMDGYETCKQLKRNKEFAKIPIIFISALSGILDKVKAFNAGGLDYIEKPFHMDEVLIRVHTQLTVRRQADQLQQAIIELKLAQSKVIQSEKMASLGTFSAGIAHEINNPINFVNAGATSVEMDLRDLLRVLDTYDSIDLKKHSPELADEIELVKNEVDYRYVREHIMDTVKDIKMGAERTKEIVYSLTRFTRGDGEQKYKTRINEEIENVVKIVKRLSKKKILFLLDLQKDIKTFDGFSGQLNQLFMNLITNAEQAIEQEGIIKIATLNKKEGINIIISDNGGGIPEDLGSRIFDPFLTTKEVGEGTGLGLSISYRIVENHGGTITYSSELNVGTTFNIYLPNN